MEMFTDRYDEIPIFESSDMDSAGNKSAAKKSVIRLCVILGVFSVVCTVYTLVTTGSFPWFFVIATVLFIAFLSAETVGSTQKICENNFNAFRFYEDRYVNYDRLSKTSVPYELMTKAVETKDSIMLFCEPTRYHTVLKSTLTHGDPEELSGFLRARIKNYKIRK